VYGTKKNSFQNTSFVREANGRMSPRFAIVAVFSCLTCEGQAKDENKKNN